MTAGDDVLLNSLAERHVESYRRVVPNLSIKHWMPRWMNRTLPVTEVSTGIQTSIKDICPSWQNVVKRCRSLASWATQKDKGSVIQSGWSNFDATKCNRFTFYNTEGDGIKDPNLVFETVWIRKVGSIPDSITIPQSTRCDLCRAGFFASFCHMSYLMRTPKHCLQFLTKVSPTCTAYVWMVYVW